MRRGQTLTVGTSVTASAAASGIIVDVEIYNGSGARVARRVYGGQSFTASQTRTYSWNWSVPANQAAGTYTVKVGVFNSTWATLYTWANQADTFVVQRR